MDTLHRFAQEWKKTLPQHVHQIEHQSRTAFSSYVGKVWEKVNRGQESESNKPLWMKTGHKVYPVHYTHHRYVMPVDPSIQWMALKQAHLPMMERKLVLFQIEKCKKCKGEMVFNQQLSMYICMRDGWTTYFSGKQIQSLDYDNHMDTKIVVYKRISLFEKHISQFLDTEPDPSPKELRSIMARIYTMYPSVVNHVTLGHVQRVIKECAEFRHLKHMCYRIHALLHGVPVPKINQALYQKLIEHFRKVNIKSLSQISIQQQYKAYLIEHGKQDIAKYVVINRSGRLVLSRDDVISHLPPPPPSRKKRKYDHH
jgi:hypothetical protein